MLLGGLWLFNFWDILKLSLDLKLLLLDFNIIIILKLHDIWEDTSRIRVIFIVLLAQLCGSNFWAYSFSGHGIFFFFFFFFNLCTMHVCISTRCNLGKLYKTSMNFHSFRNDLLHLKTLNFIGRTSNLM
jgi:hypothetical protein